MAGDARIIPSSAGQIGTVPEEGLSAEGLRTYRLALGRAAKRLKLEYDRKYSRLERDLEGRVEMNIRSDATGTRVLLARSSGHSTLDEQALELLGRAVQQTRLPDSLAGRHFEFSVPIEFEIDRQ